jgi:EAL and modified HD-GYP domain-containing signal transduction protein
MIRSWATLLLLSRLSDGKPSELIVTALVRARMAELLGESDTERDGNQYFTVGLLSVLDALLDLDMQDVVKELPFDAEVCAALSTRTGPLGTVLSRVVDYEQDLGARDDADPAVAEAYLKALAWADETQQALGAPA